MRTRNHCHVVLIFIISGLLLFGLFAMLHGTYPVAYASGGEYFVKPGASGSCAQDQPCDLQTALDLAQNGDTVYVAQGTYTGSGAAVITVTRSFTLAGGWDGIGSGAVNRNAVLYPSILDGERNRRVVYISGDITPTLDGFTVANGNATGLQLSSCPSYADGCGGGIFINDAHPIIANNTITNNIAAITTSGFPTQTTGYGGGIYLNGGVNAMISHNVIISNAGSTANHGEGGGIFISIDEDNTGLLVQFNQVLSNSATTQNVSGSGGGICGGPDGAVIEGNLIQGNQYSSSGNGSGAGIYQSNGSADYLFNIIQENKGGKAVSLQHSRSRFEGNRVENNHGHRSIFLQNGPTGGGGPILINNVIIGHDLLINILGWQTVPLSVTMLHNTLVGSGANDGISIGYYVTMTMVNTIIANTSLAITNTYPASSTMQVDHTLFWTNADDGILGTNPVDGNPVLVADGYHLSLGSAAIDAGIDVGVTSDIDGDHRPLGLAVDIGADELGIPIFLPVIIRN